MEVRKLLTLALLLCIIAALGCASETYRYGVGTSFEPSHSTVAAQPNRVSHGGANPRIDRIESWVLSPRKWIRKIARRPAFDPDAQAERRDDAVDLAQEYLSVNGLHNVRIDVRAYEPREQWRRLKANPEIRPLWKYTGGTLNWLRYTVLPMRAFHSDYYDPFTNTLNINSTRPHETLFECALAKEFQRHRRLGIGTYAMLQYVPFVSLYHNARASSDVLTFSETHLEGKLTEELYPLTYSRLGSTAVSEVLSVVSISPNAPIFTRPLLRVAGGTVGRTTGSTFAQSKKREEPSADDDQMESR